MFFSIIVPVYRAEQYLEQCVDSILSQSFTSFELLLVDDGSPDRCPEMCDRYAEKDGRVKALHKKGGGASSARNAGLRAASGEYIVYLDSDDFFIDTHCLERIHEKAKEHPDLVLYKTAECNENGTYITYPRMSFSFNQEKCSLDEMVAITVRGEEFQTSAWSKSVRRMLLIDREISFPENTIGEDIDWYLQVIRCAKSYAVVDEYLYVYRRRSGSVTTSVGIRNLTDLIRIIEKWTALLIPGGGGISYLDRSLCHYLGKTYAGLLIMYATIEDKEKIRYKDKIKAYSYLLGFDGYQRTHVIRRFYKAFGFDGTVLALALLIKIRK